jgi:hypothetical protein
MGKLLHFASFVSELIVQKFLQRSLGLLVIVDLWLEGALVGLVIDCHIHGCFDKGEGGLLLGEKAGLGVEGRIDGFTGKRIASMKRGEETYTHESVIIILSINTSHWRIIGKTRRIRCNCQSLREEAVIEDVGNGAEEF